MFPIIDKWRARRTERKAQAQFKAELKEFRNEANRLIDSQGIDRQLPEIVQLFDTAESTVAGGHWRGWLVTLKDLHKQVNIDGECVIVPEWPIGNRVMHPVNIARHFSPDLDKRLNRVIVNSRGMSLCDNETELARIGTCVLDPHRLADDGRRLRNTADSVKMLTGIEIDWDELVGKTKLELRLELDWDVFALESASATA